MPLSSDSSTSAANKDSTLQAVLEAGRDSGSPKEGGSPKEDGSPKEGQFKEADAVPGSTSR